MWGKPKEWLPWYRAHDYEGNLTEHEKRQLDALRVQPKHPAAEADDLPKEVQDYINRIECELNDEKQTVLFERTLLVSAIGGARSLTTEAFGALQRSGSMHLACCS
jgi:hypothetical protein